jgi:sporulation protein YlmC with PRC-barrel domain
MSYEDRDTYGMYKSYDEKGPGPRLMGADTLIGDDVYNHQDENLGDIKEIMLDINNGRIAYAVLSFGGFLGIANKLFAVPWSALTLDTANKRFLLKVDKERLESAPGFDKDNWPDMADPTWQNTIHSYYGTKPYTGPTDTPDIPYDDTPYTKPYTDNQSQKKNLDSGRII